MLTDPEVMEAAYEGVATKGTCHWFAVAHLPAIKGRLGEESIRKEPLQTSKINPAPSQPHSVLRQGALQHDSHQQKHCFVKIQTA